MATQRTPSHNRAQAGIQSISPESRKVLWRLILDVLRNYRFSLAAVVASIVIASLAQLSSSLFTRTLIDDYIVPLTQTADPNYSPLAHTLLKLAAVLTAGALCAYAYNRIMIKVSQGTMLRLRKSMFSNMEKLPISYFDTHSRGEIMSAYTNDVDTLRQMIGQSLPTLLNSLITIVITLFSMIMLSFPLTLIAIAMTGLMMYATMELGKRSRRYFKVQQEKLAETNGFIEEMLAGQKTVKVYCHEDEAISQFESINEALRKSNTEANGIANIVMPLNGNLSTISYVLIAVCGALIALNGWSAQTLGTLVSFLTLNKSFTQPISQLSMQINNVLNASVGAERVYAITDAEPETDEGCTVREKTGENEWVWRSADGTSRKVEGDVDFRNVDFGYIPGKDVLHDLTINTSPGQKIAIVGGTGAGKTTIINLINRFYDTTRGEILFDGIPVKQISKKDLRSTLGMVLQDPHLFTGTVMDNIRYGRLDASDEECIAAAELSGAHNFILRLADGYQTALTSDGGNLSQGERQLICIARAAIANPPVLILDEATSSIDNHTEQLVQRGMDSLMQGRTTFVIAHRLSTVRNADTIIVLDHGRIVEHGSHEELIALHGKYYELYKGKEIA